MKYKIKCEDGEIYQFKNAQELLESLVNLLSAGHAYWNGYDWMMV